MREKYKIKSQIKKLGTAIPSFFLCLIFLLKNSIKPFANIIGCYICYNRQKQFYERNQGESPPFTYKVIRKKYYT